MNYEEFHGTITWSLEACYQVSDLLSLSLGTGHQSGKSANDNHQINSLRIIDDIQMGITTLSAGAWYWVPRARGMFLGADIGVGFGYAKRVAKVQPYTGSGTSVEGDWTGTGFVGRTFAGYQRGTRGRSLFGKVGYQFMNLGVFDGTVATDGSPAPGPPTDSAGQPIETDFSGLQVVVGIAQVF